MRSFTKIVPARGLFGNDPIKPDAFGADVVVLGDLDGDGVTELGVSTFADDDGGSNRGSFWIVHLRRDGTVRATSKISALQGGFGGQLRDADAFGLGLARLEDLNRDGTSELAVGAPGTDDGASLAGALWILFMDGVALQSSAEVRPDEHDPSSYRAWGNYAGNPVPGATVTLSVDVASTGHTHGVVLGVLGRTMEILGGGQALLIDIFHPAGELLRFPLLPAPVSYTFTVPVDPSLCGLMLSTQAVHVFGAQPFALSNAIDLTVCH